LNVNVFQLFLQLLFVLLLHHGTIAGCYVTDGCLKRDCLIRLIRDGVVIYTGKISSLKRFKDDASVVKRIISEIFF